MINILKKYKGYVLLGIIIIFLIIKIQFKTNKINKLEEQNNISLTLLDSVKVYKNKLNILTYEIKTFNVKYSSLEKEYDRLDKGAKNLVDKIKLLEKEKELIDATVVEQQVVIDSLYNNKPIVDKIKGTLNFIDSTQYLKYNFLVNTKKESLLIQNLTIPNQLYISHSFNKDGVSVKVVNSNDKYFKINDINSYIIPLEKHKKPPFKRYIIIGGLGVVIGGTATLLLLN